MSSNKRLNPNNPLTPFKQLDTLIVDHSNPTPSMPQNTAPIPMVTKTFFPNCTLPTDLRKAPVKPNKGA